MRKLCALLLYSILLSACGGEDTATGITEPPTSPSICIGDCFPNGVASGDVDQSSVMLWARAAFTGAVRFEYGRDPDFLVLDGIEIRESKDPDLDNIYRNPIKVDISGLSPGTQYYYRACRDSCPLTFEQGFEARGSFRTPHVAGRHGLHFGVSSCFRADLKPFVSIRNVPDLDLDFFVALGDTVYADNPHFEGARATGLPRFRRKNEYGYSQLNNANDNMFALARASTAFYVDIDDHEIINNFAGGASPRSQTDAPECKGAGSESWGVCFCDPDNDPKGNCDRPFINDTDLFKEGLQAWYEYNPVREETYGQTGDTRTAGQNKLYRYRTFGTDAALFMLDARSFRDAPIPSDPFTGQATLPSLAYAHNRTMLGAAQLEELKVDLWAAQRKGITWKFVLVPEPIQNLGNFGLADRFEGYAYERAQLLEYIQSAGIFNVVFISGDIHGTIANNLVYKKLLNLGKLPAEYDGYYSATWDISTGPVAYAPPYGPLIAEKTEKVSEYERLTPHLQNSFIEALTNVNLAFNLSPLIGLDDRLPIPGFNNLKNAFIPATLSPGGTYSSTNTFGWTDFKIDAATQNLTVKTYGIGWYAEDAKVEFYIDRQPRVVSQFEVLPYRGNGTGCLRDKDCDSGRCSTLDLGGIPVGLPTCQAKAPNGGFCLNNKDCVNDACSIPFCRPSPNGQSCLLDGQCLSGRCTGLPPKCTAKKPNGSSCIGDGQCLSDRCSGIPLKCTAKEPNGSACVGDGECVSGNCKINTKFPYLPPKKCG